MCSMMAQQVALLPLSSRVPGSILSSAYYLCRVSVYVLLMPVYNSPQPPKMMPLGVAS